MSSTKYSGRQYIERIVLLLFAANQLCYGSCVQPWLNNEPTQPNVHFDTGNFWTSLEIRYKWNYRSDHACLKQFEMMGMFWDGFL